MDRYDSADGVPAPAPGNPYAAPRAGVRAAVAEGGIELASRLSRLGGVLIDSALFAVPAFVIAMVIAALGNGPDGKPGTGWATAAFGVTAIALAVYQLVLLYRSGQTVGKRLVGVRIVRPDGSRVAFGRLLVLRYLVPGLAQAIPLVGALFSLVDALFIFAEDRRTLHDRIADTIVVNA